MNPELLYQGMQNLTIEEDEEKKKRFAGEEVRGKQYSLYADGYYDNLYPEGTPEETIIDGVWGEKSEQAYVNREKHRANAIIPIQPKTKEQIDKADPNYAAPVDPYKVKDYDQWLKDTGQDQIPELEPYFDERRESRANKQQNAYNLAQAIRSMAQAGFAGGSNAFMAQNFRPDRTTPRLQRELQNIRDAGDADIRRTKLANMSNDVRKLGLYNAYTTRQEDRAFRAEERQLDREAKTEDYKQQNKIWDRRYGKQQTTEYLQEVQTITTNGQIRAAQVKSQIRSDEIKEQARAEIRTQGMKLGWSKEDIEGVIKFMEEGGDIPEGVDMSKYDTSKRTTTTKEPHLIVTVDGKEQGMTKEQSKSKGWEIKNNLVNARETNSAEYEALPKNIKFILSNPDSMSQDDADELVRYFYYKANKQTTGDEKPEAFR